MRRTALCRPQIQHLVWDAGYGLELSCNLKTKQAGSKIGRCAQTPLTTDAEIARAVETDSNDRRRATHLGVARTRLMHAKAA